MDIHKILKRMRDSPQYIRFAELAAVCREFFGEPRQQGTSHCVFRTPWPGDPRVNIQDKNGMAKAYQVDRFWPPSGSYKEASINERQAIYLPRVLV